MATTQLVPPAVVKPATPAPATATVLDKATVGLLAGAAVAMTAMGLGREDAAGSSTSYPDGEIQGNNAAAYLQQGSEMKEKKSSETCTDKGNNSLLSCSLYFEMVFDTPRVLTRSDKRKHEDVGVPQSSATGETEVIHTMMPGQAKHGQMTTTSPSWTPHCCRRQWKPKVPWAGVARAPGRGASRRTEGGPGGARLLANRTIQSRQTSARPGCCHGHSPHSWTQQTREGTSRRVTRRGLRCR
jgi:hypothetical protein